VKATPSATSPAHNQRGFTLIDVMAAAMVLSIFVAGLGASWAVADRRANYLVLRQKAVFAANAEMERLTALYNLTDYGNVGGTTTVGYDASLPFPTTRLVYGSGGLSPYVPASKDYTTTSSATFQSGSPFLIWVAASGLGSATRNYLWLDQAHNVMARLSWTVSAITPAQCTVGVVCQCLGFLGVLPASCQKLDLYIEYPYRLVSGAATVEGSVRSVSLSTVVGRQSR
jgi:type II secretory pathway pseudopilin PulG